MSALENKAMIVTMTASMWGASVSDKALANTLTHQHRADEGTASVRKQLIGKDALKPVKAAIDLAKFIHNRMTLPWADNGQRLLSVKAHETYRDMMETAMARVDEQRRIFVDAYEAEIERARFALGDMFDENDYPDPKEVGSKFGVTYIIEPVPSAAHFVADIGDEEAERIKADLEQRAQMKLDAAMVALYERIEEALRRLIDRVGFNEDGSPRPVHATALESLQTLVEAVPSLNLTDDPKLNEIARRLRSLVGSLTIDELRYRSSKPHVVEQVSEKRKMMQAELADIATAYFGQTPAKGEGGSNERSFAVESTPSGGGRNPPPPENPITGTRTMNYTGLSPERKIRHAVQSLLATGPFFGMLALRMPFSPGQVETIAGNGIDFTYSPEWVAEATHDEIKGCIAHIVYACALKHHLRRGERDYDKWQRASRIATKTLLEAQDLWVPPSSGWAGFAAGQLEDLPCEVIYDKLPDEDGKSDPQGSPAGAGGQQTQNQPGQSGNQPPDAGDQQQSPSNAPGEVQDAPEDKQDEQDRSWDTASKQALQVSKTMGREEGKLDQSFDGQHDHRKDWETLLREYFCSMAPTDFTWSRPNRRFIDDGLYLPSLHGEGMGPIVVAIDNSGSVNEKQVNYNCANVFAIAQDVKPDRIHVILCDTRVRRHLDFDPLTPPDRIECKGGGGTRFQPVFDFVNEHQIEPDLLIYMTDTGAVDLKELDEPDYPVLWAVENDHQLGRIPFGEGLIVPTEGDAA